MKKCNRTWFIGNGPFISARAQGKLRRADKPYNHAKLSHNTKTIGKTQVIEAPPLLSIYNFNANNDHAIYRQTMAFRDKLKRHLNGKSVFIDFSNTKELTAAALLMIFATADSNRSKTNIASIIWSKSKSVNALLKQSNFQGMLAGKNDHKPLKDVKWLPVISGVGRDRAEDILDFVRDRVYGSKMDGNTEHLYGDAVTETVNNVGRHAYPNKDTSDKKWWLLCEIIDDNLYLAIFDLGVGIPKTVVAHPWFIRSARQLYPDQCSTIMDDHSKLLFKFSLSDESLIKLSMQGNVTGTQKPQHGQGSKSIKALVSETAGGKLWVFSNKGLLTYETEDEPPKLNKLPVSIGGTLIQWNIKIS